jgi:hypothetical protein
MKVEDARLIVDGRIARCSSNDDYLRKWLTFVRDRVLARYVQDGDCWRWTGMTSEGYPIVCAPAFMRRRTVLQPRRLVYAAVVSDPGDARLLSRCSAPHRLLCGDPDKMSLGGPKGGRKAQQPSASDCVPTPSAPIVVTSCETCEGNRRFLTGLVSLIAQHMVIAGEDRRQ